MSTRDEILSAAVGELIERDEGSFRVTVVAKNAGCATSVLYHHFGSRDGLIDAALIEIITRETETVRRFIESLANAAVRAVDAVELWEEFARLGHEPGRQSDRSRRARLIGAAQTRPAVRTAYRNFEMLNGAAHRSLIETLQQRGVFRSDVDPASLSLLLRAIDYGWILDDVNDQTTVNLEEWVALIRILGGAVEKKNDYLDRESAD